MAAYLSRVFLASQALEPCSSYGLVPQGSFLGPLLFSIFPDDSTLFSPIRLSAERNAVSASLNRDLNQINTWADRCKTFHQSWTFSLTAASLPQQKSLTSQSHNREQAVMAQAFTNISISCWPKTGSTEESCQTQYQGASHHLQGRSM